MEERINKLTQIISENTDLQQYSKKLTDLLNIQSLNNLLNSILENNDLTPFFEDNSSVKVELQLLFNKYSKDSPYPDSI